ncbi:MAG: orotidine-5'-phosphate decarboxylase [Candidatus Accumulibacter sp.]|jgi:orotidine-5'-phosphate decarboxylase|nr:orotidine-5'-phosphate decarboxylase [Accumulibacter sp.]
MNFIESLNASWEKSASLLCVGLDPDPEKFPARLSGCHDAIFRFCVEIVDATADLVCCFKPQIAHFSAHRAETQLEDLIAYIHLNYPEIPVILDAKRGDIGSTAERYAAEAFIRYAADAVTVNPYMGGDSIAPYLAYPDKGIALLCRTSNPGSGDLQLLDTGGMKLYERVARLAADKWNSNRQCALVVGATYPAEIARIREITGDLPLLVPGIGAQGGDLRSTVEAGCATRGTGLIINSSRAILYADSVDPAGGARKAAREMRDAINRYRAPAPTVP